MLLVYNIIVTLHELTCLLISIGGFSACVSCANLTIYYTYRVKLRLVSQLIYTARGHHPVRQLNEWYSLAMRRGRPDRLLFIMRYEIPCFLGLLPPWSRCQINIEPCQNRLMCRRRTSTDITCRSASIHRREESDRYRMVI